MNKDYQLDEWKVQPDLNCVRKGDKLVRLEPKVMQVLVELLARPGEVVHKEELIRLVWPNTFVGDDVLTRCVYELRRVFDDNPRSPRVIQTISKGGYRLIAPVTVLPASGSEAASPEKSVSNAAPVPSKEAVAASPVVVAASAPSPAEPAKPIPVAQPVLPAELPVIKRKLGRWYAIAAALVLVVAAAIWGIRSFHANSLSPIRGFKTIPFTSYPGAELQPTFSPTGDRIAFTWNGERDGETWSVYVKLIGSETPVRLTNGNAEDMSPAWSPDGKWIAFIRRAQQGNAVYLVPSIGGPERKLYDLHCSIDWDEPGTSWSPDGKYLIFPDGKSESNPSSIVALSLDTLRTKPLTFPLNSWDGDYSPVFSPNGSKIAFVRGTDVGSRDIYVMNADGSGLKQLTSAEQQIHGLAWTHDGVSVVFSSNAAGGVSLWRVPASGGKIERLPFGSDRAFTPAIALTADRLVYSQGSDTWSMIRLDMNAPHSPAVSLISSTEQDSAPKLSHDGNYVVFHSRRSGNQEIWTSSASSPNPVQLTFFNGPMTGSPSWSPDDRQIAFDSRTSGRSHIFVMSANGGSPRRVTDGEFNDILPNWSRDGSWIYFSSKRSGSWQIWKVNLASGQVQQVTRQGGFVAAESADGQWLYYTKYDMPGLWRMPVSGGSESKLLDDPPQNYWAYFSVNQNGIYFLNINGTEAAINFYDFARKTTTRAHLLTRIPVRYSSLSASQDGRWVLYTDVIERNRNLILVENFQ